MSQRFQLIHELLNYLEEYEKLQETSYDLKEFLAWMQLQNAGSRNSKEWELNPDFSNPEEVNTTDVAEAELSTLLATLFRFAKSYSKKAFEKTSFKTLDEFGFLASLFKHQSMHKSELINQHMLEISSGSEIIRRLIKLDLIQEVRDEKDKRAKLIMLTNKGRIEILLSFMEMNKAAKIIAGNLSASELRVTNYSLNKLKSFHEVIHQHDKGSDLNDLLEKYANKTDQAS